MNKFAVVNFHLAKSRTSEKKVGRPWCPVTLGLPSAPPHQNTTQPSSMATRNLPPCELRAPNSTPGVCTPTHPAPSQIYLPLLHPKTHTFNICSKFTPSSTRPVDVRTPIHPCHISIQTHPCSTQTQGHPNLDPEPNPRNYTSRTFHSNPAGSSRTPQ